MPIIAKAGDDLKEDVLEDFVVRGEVTGLKRSKNSMGGKATIRGFVEGKGGYINVNLTETEYIIAAQAHQERTPVSCRGDLKRRGTSFVLFNPRDFALLSE